jgi:Mor family transcriptional regulator
MSMSQEKTERNQALYNDSKTGLSIIDLVAKYRINSSAILTIIKRYKNMEAQGLTINPAGKLSVGTITEGKPQ